MVLAVDNLKSDGVGCHFLVADLDTNLNRSWRDFIICHEFEHAILVQGHALGETYGCVLTEWTIVILFIIRGDSTEV